MKKPFFTPKVVTAILVIVAAAAAAFFGVDLPAIIHLP